MVNLSHNAYQRSYYENALKKPAMQVADSPYVWRHVLNMMTAADLSPAASTLEIGAGLGKFSIPLLEKEIPLTCLDLSPVMLTQLASAAQLKGFSVTTLTGDATEISKLTDQKFDRAIGFFMLHHVEDLTRLFRGLKEGLKPGATITFCEPAGTNPLYLVQVLCTPGMRWAAEKGILKMTPKQVLGAMQEAGFKECSSHSYGFLPPVLYNRRFGPRAEHILERVPGKSVMHAFRVFQGRLPAKSTEAGP